MEWSNWNAIRNARCWTMAHVRAKQDESIDRCRALAELPEVQRSGWPTRHNHTILSHLGWAVHGPCPRSQRSRRQGRRCRRPGQSKKGEAVCIRPVLQKRSFGQRFRLGPFPSCFQRVSRHLGSSRFLESLHAVSGNTALNTLIAETKGPPCMSVHR